MCNEKDTNCIAEILSVILVLQQNVCGDSCLDSCDRPMLGGGVNCLICNTRPVMLYTCSGNGVPWSIPTCKDYTGVCNNGELIGYVIEEIFDILNEFKGDKNGK